MTAWAHLPNAAHIDQVLAHLEAHPEKWATAWDAAQSVTRSADLGAARALAWDAAQSAARGAAWSAARYAIWNVTWSAAWSAAWNAAWSAAWGAISALVAYDDAAIFLSKPVEHLRTLYRIDPHPTFLLLQPAAIVMPSHEITP